MSLFSRLRTLRSMLRVAGVRAAGAQLEHDVFIGPGCDLCPGLEPARRGLIRIAAGATLVQNVVLHPYGGHVFIGARVHLGPGVVVYGHGGVDIGEDCLIGMHCQIVSSNHALPPAGQCIRWQPDEKRPTRIGRDVWLGAGVTVLGGVTLGDGCIVGAGAVVTRDVPAGAIVAGVPAKIIGHRPGTTP
jgi:acetyltransferase-like isoleucine patch superfamily enzyme